MPKVILVDKNDNEIGTGEKLTVHKKGQLHRAFSVLIFNSQSQMLIQQRADNKYHSAGLWANTCCSHPRPGEEIKKAVKRRLKEEMGLEKCKVKEVFKFFYRVELGDLIENELDHVFCGICEKGPSPDKKEVKNWQWIDQEALKKDVAKHPQKYAYWFKLILDKIFSYNFVAIV